MSHVPQNATERMDPWRVRVKRFRQDMHAEGRVYADRKLWPAIRADLTLEQVVNTACLPGVVGAAMAMPDAHQGYGFPIGGVVATDVATGGVVSPGGVGFDINCGVRLLATTAEAEAAEPSLDALMDGIFGRVPVGFGKARGPGLGKRDMDGVLGRGAAWAVDQGYGVARDLEHTESRGCLPWAEPAEISERSRSRGARQLGTLGSGNHFVEVQRVDAVLDDAAAQAFGLHEGQLVVLVHTGSRGLGHQVCTEATQTFRSAMKRHGIQVPDIQLACAPVESAEGRAYLGAMAAAANFAWANRQVITHRVREALAEALGKRVHARVVYDVAHNIAKLEDHEVDGTRRKLCVHRKGATRAFPAHHPEIPTDYRAIGQPVFIPGSMGTSSWVLVGTERALEESFGSVCHGAGRAMSRTKAKKTTTARDVRADLDAKGIRIRAGSQKGIVEEFPGAYKDVRNVIDVVEGAGLARPVAKLVPMGVVKG